jgi:dTDP-4-amino-4,6-dideoxygalactose transaminase
MTKILPFENPIYVTRPLLPKLDEFLAIISEIWDDRWLTNNGKKHQLLEEKLKGLLKVPYLSLFNNGTIALVVGCKALGISGEVITTPFTFPATPHALAWNNLKPVFCDIDPLTMNIDAHKIEDLITSQTSAILGVHVYGTPCDVIKIQSIADMYGLKVIYDAAHAFLVEIDGVGIGNYGDLSMVSFHATKLFHTAEGGALMYKDEKLKLKIELLKNFGIKNEEEVASIGINGKMSEIHAALGLSLLKYLQQEYEARKRIANIYRERLTNVEGITLPIERLNITSSYQYFPIRINSKYFGCDRDFVYTELKKYNVFTRKYFYPLCSEYPSYKDIPSANKQNLPNAHQIVNEVLCLPIYGDLNTDTVHDICTLIHLLQR